jgi:Tfp pilus assembly protein PilF
MRACAERARDLNPMAPRIRAELGRIQFAMGEESAARETLKAAADLARNDGDTFRLIGLAWLKHGHKDEAMKAYEEMVRRDPRDQGNLADAGTDLLECGHPEEAKAFMERAWKMDPKDRGMLVSLALTLLEAGHRSDALVFMERAFQADPKEEDTCETFAMALLERGDAEGAELWLDRFYLADRREFNKEWIKCVRIARKAHKKGLTSVAIKWFERAYIAAPKEEHVWMDIATMLAESKEPKAGPGTSSAR